MNNQEAWNRIDAIIARHEIDDDYVTITSILDYDALRMARKALEQEPCEDAISRQAVIDVIKSMSNANPSYWNKCDVVDREDLIDEISELPSVKQEPKTGHWIEHPEIETSIPEYLMFYECSECGDKQCFCKSDIHKKHFCNNCGARMIELQEGSDKE